MSLKFFLLISIPMASFFMAWSEPILTIALGSKYLPAIPAMQLLGLGLVPFFLSTLFQYLFAALDEQKRFLASTCVASGLRLLLLFLLIPFFGFIGPAIAFVCAETVIVSIWIVQLAKLGFPAHMASTMWRPLLAGVIMCAVFFSGHGMHLIARIGVAALGIGAYIMVLFALKTFSSKELHQVREGIGFVSPFIESWTKKLRRDA
jgi:O-antigen/teichoic acid export membrane protein